MSKAKKADEGMARQFVLDCSLALAWCFPDEKADYPQAVLDSLVETTAIVPALWQNWQRLGNGGETQALHSGRHHQMAFFPCYTPYRCGRRNDYAGME